MYIPLPQNTVIMVWDTGKENKRQPFMLQTSEPDTMRAVAFASKDLGESLMQSINLGQPVWLEPVNEVVATYPDFFISNEVVFFENKQAINRFVHEGDFLPLRKLKEKVVTYPCEWSFAIIGSDEDMISSAVSSALGSREHVLESSHTSSNKKYISFSLQTSVDTEEHRDKIYNTLKEADGVKMVL